METEVKKTTGPRDVFSHLLSIIFLYVSVIGFGILLFGIIDVYFPDVLSDTYGWYAKSALRWPLALLVVIFPLYLWFTSYLERDLEKNPEKRALKIRKWLLYFTLFVATLVIVGDLVSVIFSFLNGELTLRFVLKVLTVLALALSVFVDRKSTRLNSSHSSTSYSLLFFNDTATTEIYTLSLHDALPIYSRF